MRNRARRTAGALALTMAMGALAMPASASPPPTKNVVPPAVTGVPVSGQALSYYRGFWTLGGSPYIFSQHWLRCDATGGSCTGTGVTTATYTITGADVGHTLRVAVTNRADNGNQEPVTVNSLPSAPVAH